MLRRGVDALMTECLLRLTNIPLGELRAHEPPDVMRLDLAQPHLIGIALHDAPAALDRAPSRITSGTGVTWGTIALGGAHTRRSVKTGASIEGHE